MGGGSHSVLRTDVSHPPTPQHLIPGKDSEFQEVLRLGCGHFSQSSGGQGQRLGCMAGWCVYWRGGGSGSPTSNSQSQQGPAGRCMQSSSGRWPKTRFSCEIKTGKLVSIFTRKQGLNKGLSLHGLHVPPRQGLKHSLHWLNARVCPSAALWVCGSGSETLWGKAGAVPPFCHGKKVQELLWFLLSSMCKAPSDTVCINMHVCEHIHACTWLCVVCTCVCICTCVQVYPILFSSPFPSREPKWKNLRGV